MRSIFVGALAVVMFSGCLPGRSPEDRAEPGSGQSQSQQSNGDNNVEWRDAGGRAIEVQPPGRERVEFRFTPDEPDIHGAWAMCQLFVEKELKSPSTASYGSIFRGDLQNAADIVSPLGNRRYRVKAWVDSQNSFGATIRTRFVCELTYTGNGNWSCTRLEFD